MIGGFRTLLLGGIAVAGMGPIGLAPQISAVHREHVLGTSFDLTLVGADAAARQRAEAAVIAEIRRLDLILSSWRGDSELAALNRATAFAASPDLYTVVAFAEHMRALSNGAFSARLGEVRKAWAHAENIAAPPDAQMLAALSERGASSVVALDDEQRLIQRPEGVSFDLDGLAKGYVIDCALKAARKAAPEIRGMLLDIGGDIRVWGEGPGSAWRVGLADPACAADNALPARHVALGDQAIAASGAGARDISINGARYAHFIDPFTGMRVQGAHATVTAPSAMQADALSTALALMTPSAGLDLINAVPGAAARIVGADGAAHETPLWRTISDPAPATAAPAAAWPNNFALNINYEIPRADGGDYQRPNVAIWISDGDRRLVRTLLVLGDKPRWRESNYIWWRRFERMSPDAIQAIARPTRAPGRYTLAWDGRDEQGRAAPQGHYVLNIEASREHGGHSITQIPLDLAAAPQTASANAEEEMGAVTIRYGANP